MASELTLTHVNGLRKSAYIGWSWTSFFFGGFPALFRGDFLGFFVWLITAIVVTAVTSGFGALVMLFVWPMIYNRWHARRLIERGYQLTGAAIPMEQARARVMG